VLQNKNADPMDAVSRRTLYFTWANMHKRCRTSAHYIRKGITVCPEWGSFEKFVEDMGPKPAGLTLDREENTKGYNAKNCRWTDLITQANNTERNVFITYGEETKTLAQWGRARGLTYNTVAHRLKRGWSVERLLNTPPMKNQYEAV